jgi:hypothetical protein
MQHGHLVAEDQDLQVLVGFVGPPQSKESQQALERYIKEREQHEARDSRTPNPLSQPMHVSAHDLVSVPHARTSG